MIKEDFVKDLLAGNIKMEDRATDIFGDTKKITNDEVEEAMDFLSSIILGGNPKQEVKNTNINDSVKKDNRSLSLPILTKEDVENKNDIKDTIKTSIDTIEVTKGEKFKRGDKVKIVQGDYKGLDSKKCIFLDYVKSMNAVLLQLDDYNRLYVKEDDIELIKPIVEKYEKKIWDEISNTYAIVEVIKNNIKESITVKIKNTKCSVGMSQKIIEKLNIKNPIRYCYYKAKVSQYSKYANHFKEGVNNVK